MKGINIIVLQNLHLQEYIQNNHQIYQFIITKRKNANLINNIT
jgi:hypothetical protein